MSRKRASSAPQHLEPERSKMSEPSTCFTSHAVERIDVVHLEYHRPHKMSAKSAASSVRLSDSLKALIAAPQAYGSAIPAPPRPAFQNLFNKISSTAEKHGARNDTWLTLSTGALVTVNSPASLCELYDFASEKQGKDLKEQIRIAAVSIGLLYCLFSLTPGIDTRQLHSSDHARGWPEVHR